MIGKTILLCKIIEKLGSLREIMNQNLISKQKSFNRICKDKIRSFNDKHLINDTKL